MFTGLIEGRGIIKKLVPERGGLFLEVESEFELDDVQEGDSIAVDGACLTALNIRKKSFSANVSPETLEKTTFKYKKTGDMVNLERALRLGDRLGGHLVSGHVDGIGKILSINPLQDFYRFLIKIPDELSIYLVEKGSIAIDGISLTINKILEKNQIELMIIPHTLKKTTLCIKNPGDPVNIEIDMIAKMVHNWLSPYLRDNKQSEKKLTVEFLKEHGFF